MKREINPRLNYIKSTIQFLSELSRAIGVEKHFVDMTRDDVLFYLDKFRKPENEDPLHKWIGSYNLKRITLIRFFKWLRSYLVNVSANYKNTFKHLFPYTSLSSDVVNKLECLCISLEI
ncbi:MAG: hypothetical protein WBE68_18045, partial [Candidatus Nitrosopolaris sp.]